MALLKKNSTGPEVAGLISRLARLGYLPAGASGSVFDATVVAAVKNFQSSHVGPNGLPLKVDGVVGPLTQFAIAVALGELPEPPNRCLPPPEISGQAPPGCSRSGWNALKVAMAEMKDGAGEVGGNDRGPYCRKYLGLTELGEGNDWCAAFVSWCFHTGNPGAMPYAPTPGARATLKAFKQKGWAFQASFDNPPKPGDIIVWWRHAVNDWRGHIGIVSDYSHGIVRTIEGNRSPRVENFCYTLGQIDKLLGFGRAQPTA